MPQSARAHVGRFGGAEGLARWMAGREVRLLVDATHPFAARMGWNAHEAAGIAGVPLVRLERPAPPVPLAPTERLVLPVLPVLPVVVALWLLSLSSLPSWLR